MSYQEKIITVEQALSLVKSNDIIVSAMAGAEAKLFFGKLHTIADKVKNVSVTNCLPFLDADYFTNETYKDVFQVDSWFYSGALRKAHNNGNISFIPNHLHLAGLRRLSHQKPHIFVGTATYPNKHGYLSLSLSNVYEKKMIEAADIVILEINHNFPKTYGDLEIHESEIDYFIEADYRAPVLPEVESNDKDKIIGKFIADLIHDGDSIQLGIGGIPNAVAAALINKKDLGIHTEMFTTGMMKLVKAGVINGSKKTLHKGKHVACFALGTQELYDFIDDNPSVSILDGNYVNDPYIIGKNDNQVSINTTIEIDLTGQCCSESIGTRQFSGTGGQADTAIGAQNAKNGRSFIALYSTAMVKDPVTGERVEVSKIVPTLKAGAGVTLSRNDVDHVVTEYGVAVLRGTSIRERVDRLTAIAHPKFRDGLRKEAIELGIISE
jgi:acyl-CoA hydrolase